MLLAVYPLEVSIWQLPVRTRAIALFPTASAAMKCALLAAVTIFLPEIALSLDNGDNRLWASIAWQAAGIDVLLVHKPAGDPAAPSPACVDAATGSWRACRAEMMRALAEAQAKGEREITCLQLL